MPRTSDAYSLRDIYKIWRVSLHYTFYSRTSNLALIEEVGEYRNLNVQKFGQKSRFFAPQKRGYILLELKFDICIP